MCAANQQYKTMAQAAKRDPNNPILNSPYAEPGSHYATDQAGNLNYDDVREGRRIFVTDTPTIPFAQREPGMEADNPVVQAKGAADYPLNPVTTRGQDPELYWMHKYGPADEETRLKIDIRSLYRHEHVEPEALIHRLYKITKSETPQNDMFVNETLKVEIDDEAFDRLYGFRSHPIPAKKGKRIAVRVVSQFGEESTKVISLG